MASKSTTQSQYGGSSTGGTGSSGTLTGSAYGYTDAYGGKPDTSSPSSTAASAISGTTSNLSSLYGLASSVNQFNTQQALQSEEATTPGYAGNMSKWASDISSLLSGQVSSDTKYQLQEAAAERGVSTGTSGSQASNSSYLRALGLTSLGLEQTGASQLASMLGSSVKTSNMDLSPYMTTASDQQNAQQYANTVASTASPAASAAASTAAAKSGLSTGASLAGGNQGGGGTSSIASLLSSILGTGGAGTITGSGTGTSGITSALNSILGTDTGGATATTDTGSGYNDVATNPDYYGGDTGYTDVPATGE
jgi:hypothetical protein